MSSGKFFRILITGQTIFWQWCVSTCTDDISSWFLEMKINFFILCGLMAGKWECNVGKCCLNFRVCSKQNSPMKSLKNSVDVINSPISAVKITKRHSEREAKQELTLMKTRVLKPLISDIVN